ncbi:MAG: transposase family protein [Nitrospira sp.]
MTGPRSITVDHGTEFQSRALEDWAYRRGVQLDFIRPGKPRRKCLH